MEFIDCKSIAQKWKDEVKAHGIKAKFYVLQVGDDPASSAYIKGKIKDAAEVGWYYSTVAFAVWFDNE